MVDVRRQMETEVVPRLGNAEDQPFPYLLRQLIQLREGEPLQIRGRFDCLEKVAHSEPLPQPETANRLYRTEPARFIPVAEE